MQTAAVTKAGFYPGYLNATRNGDRTVTVMLRAHPDEAVVAAGRMPNPVALTLTEEQWADFQAQAAQL